MEMLDFLLEYRRGVPFMIRTGYVRPAMPEEARMWKALGQGFWKRTVEKAIVDKTSEYEHLSDYMWALKMSDRPSE